VVHQKRGQRHSILRYFKGEEKADLRKNRQEYVGSWPREISGTAAKGLWVNKDLETDISNLFGAGDEVGGLPWQASTGAFTQGWHAGDMAARRAAQQKAFAAVSDLKVKARKKMCTDILDCKRGYHWREVETGIQNLMDFYCGNIRSEGLLTRGLDRLEDAKAACLKAENPHELGRCLDVKSIIDNAELVLRSSLERKESRPIPFGFRRADYPKQDDKNWKIFLAIQKDADSRFIHTKLSTDG
jgi:succinate dehydrogenase/fumarate reductase flavoprotein subunit